MGTNDPDYVSEILNDVRSQIAVDDHVLSETKERRNLVKRIAKRFDGSLKTFDSGSVAHGTVNKPVSDADCGLVLDRRSFPELGPDGDNDAPNEVVEQVKDLVIEAVREDYPDATAEVTKRAILVEFEQPIDDEQDPSVDLIVALARAEEDGRWIPNVEDESWDASDPEKHTDLLVGPDKNARVHRARVIRLAKAAVKQDEQPVVSSFNLEALALDLVDEDVSVAEALRTLFLEGADDLAEGDTPDPAEVSDPIKLPEGISRDEAVDRLSVFGEALDRAIESSADDAVVREELAKLFPDFVDVDPSEKRKLADALKTGDKSRISTAFGASAAALPPTRAFGGSRAAE